MSFEAASEIGSGIAIAGIALAVALYLSARQIASTLRKWLEEEDS